MSYIPHSFHSRHAWLVNLKTEVATHAPTLGWPPAKVAAFNALIDPLIDIYQTLINAETAYREAVYDAGELFRNQIADLRANIFEIKANPLFTEGMGAGMKIFSPSNNQPVENIKPVLTAKAQRGGILLGGSKNYAETINIYTRRAGQTTWAIIATKRKRLPFEDQTPLAVPGTPEVREYMARGVNGDEEIGQDSDIVTAIFAG